MPPKNPVPVETISCHECLTEIPGSVSRNGEADEYVYNYCGLDCYDKWLEQQRPTEQPQRPSRR